MADDTVTAPETHDEPKHARLTPAEAWEALNGQDRPLHEITNIARAIGSCAMAGDEAGFDERDAAAMLVLVDEIDRRVALIEDVYSKVWHGLWHYRHGRRPQEEGATS